jgi:hypothetical protein
MFDLPKALIYNFVSLVNDEDSLSRSDRKLALGAYLVRRPAIC